MEASTAQAESHGQRLKEKGARETGLPSIMAWPTDADGNPMTVVVGAASDLVPTVQFGNVQIGPVTIMRPVVDDGDDAKLIEQARFVQKMAEFVVGAERRIIQWATNPASRVINPATGEALDPSTEQTPAQFAEQAAAAAAAPVAGTPAAQDAAGGDTVAASA